MSLDILSINIRRREKILESKNNSNTANIRLLAESMLNNTPNMFIVEQVFKNWRQLDYNNDLAFSKVLNILKEFCSKASDSQKNNAINIFKENVLFTVDDSKKAKKILENTFNDEELLEYTNNLIMIDRVIKNKKSLNRRGNVNKLFNEANLTSLDSIENTIIEACDIINTLPIKFGTKYTVAVENIKYCLDCINHSDFSDQQILETVTDYFLFNIKNERDVNSIINIIENTKLYSDKDKNRFNFLKGVYESKKDPFAEYIIEADDKSDKPDPSKEKAEKQAQDMLDDFKKKVKKEPSALKSIISTIYTKSPDMIIDELPNIFSVLRNCILLSSIVVSPFLTIVIFIADKFISMGLKRDKTEKMLDKFKAERKKMKKKLASAKTDAQKKKLEAYIKKLDDAIAKITDYRDSLYSERENDEREPEYDDDDIDSSDSGDDDFDFDFDDFKFESCIDPNIEKDYNLDCSLGGNWIDLREYYNIYHENLIRSLCTCRNTILNRMNRLQSKLYDYKYTGEIDVISEEEISKLSNKDINIVEFMINDRIHIPILSVDIAAIMDQSCIDDIYYIYDDIINTIEDSTPIIFVCIENSGTIYLSLSAIKIRADLAKVNENVMYRPDLIKMATIMQALDNIKTIAESFKNIDDNTSLVCKYISEMNSSNLKEFNLLCKNSICVNNDKINDALVDLRNYNRSINNLSESTFINTLLDNKYSNSINTLDELYYQSLVESTLSSSLEVLHELSITNTLKMASDKLKNSVEKLTDKEKLLSKRLDDAIENFKRKVEISLTNKNRESVIKSTILPSASTCLKIILGASIVGWLVNPYIAVIGTLGMLAVSKAGNIKERQFILDEINVQLELIEKKKQLAENNNDMKALEALMQMEAKLKRERQRIKYKLKDYTVLNIDRQ